MGMKIYNFIMGSIPSPMTPLLCKITW